MDGWNVRLASFYGAWNLRLTSRGPCDVCAGATAQMIDIKSSKLVRLQGKVENTERFVGLALFQVA